MPSSPGKKAQRAPPLSQVPHYLLSEFPRYFADGVIVMPDGYMFNPPKPLHQRDVTPSGPLVIDAMPLTMFLRHVTCTGGSYFVTGHGDPDVSYRNKGSKTGDWSGIGLINVDQGCGGDTTLRFAGMSFGTEPEPVTLDATKLPDCEAWIVATDRDARLSRAMCRAR